MTREEALETWLPVIEMAIVDTNIPEAKEALEMAIEALQQEPCDDCIRRSDIGLTDFEIVMCNGDYKEGLKMLLDKIENAPSVTPQPKMGHWVKVIEENGHAFYLCSVCKEGTDENYDWCPFCGSKMQEVEG